MYKRLMAIFIVGLLINMTSVKAVVAATNPDKEARFVEKVKAAIAKLGTGPDARVEVKLRDKTKLKGYISEIAADHFMVSDSKTGTATPVAYPQVKQVKGNNLSTGAKIAIGIAVGVGILLALFLIGKNVAQ